MIWDEWFRGQFSACEWSSRHTRRTSSRATWGKLFPSWNAQFPASLIPTIFVDTKAMSMVQNLMLFTLSLTVQVV